jgi:predicted nucleotide-binding protein
LESNQEEAFQIACLVREKRLADNNTTYRILDDSSLLSDESLAQDPWIWWRKSDLLAEFPKPTETIDRALKNLSRLEGIATEAVSMEWKDLSFLLFCRPSGVPGIFKTMVKKNYLHEISSNRACAVFTITPDGWDRMETKEKDGMATSPDTNTANRHEVFVVHGHDDALRSEVCRLLEKLGLKPIVLFEQPDKGRTVIEKFEQHANVGYAVVLLTPDDEGGLRGKEQVTPRARQNVIFELGFFYGKLGRKNVCAILKEGLEFPSDINGVIYKRADHAGAWRLELAKEMKAAGLGIDLNKL